MTTRYPVQCAACKHMRAAPTPSGHPACDAFPGGIPNRIAYYGADHRQPVKGDHGIQFELAEGDQAAEAFENWRLVHEEVEGGNQTTGG